MLRWHRRLRLHTLTITTNNNLKSYMRQALQSLPHLYPIIYIMNEISKIDPHRIETGRNFSTPMAQQVLIQAGGIVFAVCERTSLKLLYGFASSTLARFLAETKKIQISDAQIIHQSIHIGCETESERILQLKVTDGSLVIVNSYDHLYLSTPYVSIRDRGKLLNPSQVWGLTANGFMSYMLLTERMVDFLECRAQDGQHGHLLKVLWREYQLATEHTEQRTVSIEGEFLDFSAREFAHGLVIFDTA